MNIKDWKEELQDYCEEYGIKTPLLIPRYKMQGIIEEGFTKNLEPDKRFYGEDIERIKGIIRRNYGIKYTQIKKINESLEEQGVSFRIYSGKETSKEHRNETYYQIISPEELEARAKKSKKKTSRKSKKTASK